MLLAVFKRFSSHSSQSLVAQSKYGSVVGKSIAERCSLCALRCIVRAARLTALPLVRCN